MHRSLVVIVQGVGSATPANELQLSAKLQGDLRVTSSRHELSTVGVLYARCANACDPRRAYEAPAQIVSPPYFTAVFASRHDGM